MFHIHLAQRPWLVRRLVDVGYWNPDYRSITTWPTAESGTIDPSARRAARSQCLTRAWKALTISARPTRSEQRTCCCGCPWTGCRTSVVVRWRSAFYTRAQLVLRWPTGTWCGTFCKTPIMHDTWRGTFCKNPLKPPSVGGFRPPSNTWSLLSRARCVPKIIPIA